MAITSADDTDFSELISSSPRVAVKYYADWCGSCRLLAPKFRSLSEREEFAGIVFLDVNAELSPVARSVAEVDTLPFFAAFRDGKLVEGIATAKEENVVNLLERLSQ